PALAGVLLDILLVLPEGGLGFVQRVEHLGHHGANLADETSETSKMKHEEASRSAALDVSGFMFHASVFSLSRRFRRRRRRLRRHYAGVVSFFFKHRPDIVRSRGEKVESFEISVVGVAAGGDQVKLRRA